MCKTQLSKCVLHKKLAQKTFMRKNCWIHTIFFECLVLVWNKWFGLELIPNVKGLKGTQNITKVCKNMLLWIISRYANVCKIYFVLFKFLIWKKNIGRPIVLFPHFTSKLNDLQQSVDWYNFFFVYTKSRHSQWCKNYSSK